MSFLWGHHSTKRAASDTRPDLSLHTTCLAGDATRVRELLKGSNTTNTINSHDEVRTAISPSLVPKTDDVVSRPLAAPVRHLVDATASGLTDIFNVVRALAEHGANWDASSALCVCFASWALDRITARPLADVPIEVVECGAEATQTYVDCLKQATQPTRIRHRLCVVGARACGKLSLVQALTGANDAPSEPTNAMAFGLDRYPWMFTHQRVTTHQLHVWDFTGGADDATTQRLVSVLTTARWLHVVCVDAPALLLAAAAAAAAPASESNAAKVTNDGTDTDGSLAAFVDTNILPWVSALLSTNPTGIVLVLTKTDLVAAAPIEDVMTHVTELLERQIQRRAALDDVTSQPARLRWFPVSCNSGTAIRDTTTQFESFVADRNRPRCVEMPASYQRAVHVLDAIRFQNATVHKSDRASRSIVPVVHLLDKLQASVPALGPQEARAILHALHDLGELLWFDHGPMPLRDFVMLDPTVVLDCMRVVLEVPRSDRNADVMPHASLMALPQWHTVDDVVATALKQLLVEATLAYVPRGAVEWDSDLIVPTYWKTDSTWATPLSVTDDALAALTTTNDPTGSIIPTTPVQRVRWQYHFMGPVPHDVYERVLVESYSPLWGRTIACNGIVWEMAHDPDEEGGPFACRLVIDQEGGVPGQSVVYLSAVAFMKDAPSWWIFQFIAQAIERVLDRYKDDDAETLLVSRCALNDNDEPRRLESVVAYWDEAPKAFRATITWLPPDISWFSKILVTRRKATA